MQGLKHALLVAKQDKDVKTITFLVHHQSQYESFLEELNFNPFHYKKHIAQMCGYEIQIHTVRTYHPSYRSTTHPKCEILIAIGVPPKELERFEDYSNIKYWIIIPYGLNENYEWLSIFEAEDINTKEIMLAPSVPDSRILNAINWLNETSFPNSGFYNPLDKDRLYQLANALKHYRIQFNYASTVKCAIDQGMKPSSARKTAEAFERARKHSFLIKNPPYDFRFLLQEQP